MKELLYVGTFNPWTEKHEDELFEALQTFDKVTIGVRKINKKKPMKGQPTKILNGEFKNRIKIIYFNKLSSILPKSGKYIMFEV